MNSDSGVGRSGFISSDHHDVFLLLSTCNASIPLPSWLTAAIGRFMQWTTGPLSIATPVLVQKQARVRHTMLAHVPPNFRMMRNAITAVRIAPSPDRRSTAQRTRAIPLGDETHRGRLHLFLPTPKSHIHRPRWKRGLMSRKTACGDLLWSSQVNIHRQHGWISISVPFL